LVGLPSGKKIALLLLRRAGLLKTKLDAVFCGGRDRVKENEYSRPDCALFWVRFRISTIDIDKYSKGRVKIKKAIAKAICEERVDSRLLCWVLVGKILMGNT
jgi:hypothetical protein